MAYLPKLNPTVGGGLGGLPERRGVATDKGLQTEEVSISLLGSVTNGDYIYKSKDGNYYQTKNYTYFPKNGDYTSATLFKPYEVINDGATRYFSMYRYSPASGRFLLGSSSSGPYGCARVYDSNGISLFDLCTGNSSYYQGTRVAVSPDGSKEMLFCASSYVSYYGTIVTRHDGKAYTAQTNSTVYNYPSNFAINNNGDIFVVYDNGNGTLYVSKVLLDSTENKYSYSSSTLQVNGTVLVALNNNNFILLSSTSLYYFDSSLSLITSNVVNFPFSTSMYHNPLGVMNRLNGNVLLTKPNGSLYELVLSGTTFTFNTLYNTTSFYEMGAVSESSDGYIFVSSINPSFDNAYTLDSSFALVTDTGFSSHVRCLSPIDNGWVCGFPAASTNPSKHIKTNKELLYFVGVANESKTYSQNNTPINVKVLTSGVKTTAIDYRNVGGAALLTSAITP